MKNIETVWKFGILILLALSVILFASIAINVYTIKEAIIIPDIELPSLDESQDGRF